MKGNISQAEQPIGGRGFTLIELMITVAIIAILAAVVFPSYQQYLLKSRRAEAQSTLMDAASRQQQFMLDTRGYTDTFAALNVTVPASVGTHYTLTLSVGTATVPAFTVTATPQGSQSKDACKPLTLSHTGVKAPAACW